MENLTTGLKLQKVEDSDDVSVFNPALKGNIQKINDHTHDGINSPKTAGTVQSIPAGGYSDLGGGNHRKTISMPTGISYDDVAVQIKDATGERTYPTIEKVTSGTWNLTVNDPTQVYTATYTS